MIKPSTTKIGSPLTWQELVRFKTAGLTYGAIGAMYGVSRQRIHQIFVSVVGRGKGRQPVIRTGACRRCGKEIVNYKRENKTYCSACLPIVKSATLKKTKRRPEYLKALSEAKRKWWAENPERKEKARERKLKYWELKRGEQSGKLRSI